MKLRSLRAYALLAVTCPFFVTPSLRAQQTSSNASVDPQTLSRYDKNHNGVLDPDERAAMEADQAKATPVQTTSSSNAQPGASDEEKDVIKLTPFEVSTAEDRGYYSANSTSGTRFNTKVSDLAASLTVIGKRQMKDFGMVDINDVFKYAASTQGTATYTAVTVDRNGSVGDGVQSNPTQANLVRGLAPANISYNNTEMTGRMPLDSALMDAVEISRGPNASVFGLGNPSGTVNQVAVSANLSRNMAEVSARGDSYGGFRDVVDVNRVLIDDKLAVRFVGVFQHEGFERKPSGVNDVYYDGMFKYKPFKNTTISASLLYYRMNGNRPNFIPPRDNISYWIASGRPTWDPVTQTVHLNGQTLGPFPTATGLPDYFTATYTGGTRTSGYVNANGQLTFLQVPTATLTSTPLTAQTGDGTRLLAPQSGAGVSNGRITNQPLFTTTPTVNSKSIYDYTDVNISAVNRSMDSELVSNLQIDQQIFQTERQQLFGQLFFLREDAQRYQRNLVGTANDNGQSGQLFVDVNERNLDGSANPYFLQPYIGTDQPRTTWSPTKWDTYRAQLNYKLDFTNNKGWTKWLGTHTVTGYDEYKYRISRNYSYRDAITSNNVWIPAGTPRGNQGAVSNGGPPAAPNATRIFYRYYVGDTNGSNIDFAPSNFAYGNTKLLYGNSSTGFVTDPVTVGQVAVTDATGAGSNLKTILKTAGGVIQSNWIEDRLVTTLGEREDKQYTKSGATPQLLNADGETFNFDSLNHWKAGDYGFNSGKTTQAGAVVRPFKDLGILRGLSNSGRVGGILGDFLNGFQLTYNKSDSFLPQDPKMSLYQKPLPNSTGNGKDYGFAFTMFNNKVNVRVNHYETAQLDSRAGDAPTIAQRVLRMDMASTAAFLLQTQVLAWIPFEPGFANATPAQIQAQAGKEMGIPYTTQLALNDAFNAGTISTTSDIAAHGTEVEFNFNPTQYWTVSGNFTDGKTITSNVSPDLQSWINSRLPIWTTITDPRGPDHIGGTADDAPVLWWTQNYGGSQTAMQNYGTFIQTPFSVVQQSQGKSNPQLPEYGVRVSTSLNLAGLTDHHIIRNFTVGGAVRWQSAAAIGYYGVKNAQGVYTDLNVNTPVYDTAHTYIDAFVSYRTRLFDKVGATFQLNVSNMFESGRLQPITAFPDGTISTYRIVDPRQFVLQATFDL